MLSDKDARWFMFFYGVTFGGFVGLASSPGYSKQLTSSYQAGLLIFAALALTGLATVKSCWRTTWVAAHMTAVRI